MDLSGERTASRASHHVSVVPTGSAFAGAIVPVDVVSVPAIQSSGKQHIDHPNTLVPLTVKQVTMLVPSMQHGGGGGIHGAPVTTARLLGRMLNRRDMTEEIDFILADGTGAIQGRIWKTQSEYMLDLRSVSDGDYVIVNGCIKSEGCLKHIRVYSLRFVSDSPATQFSVGGCSLFLLKMRYVGENKQNRVSLLFCKYNMVTNYNVVTHHFLHCVYVHLDLQKKYRESQNDIRRIDLAVAAHEQSSPVSDSGNRLFDAVLRVFYHPGVLELENGASFTLIQSQTGADAEQLRSVIGAHVAMGNLFTTIDDDHYKCSFNG